MRTLYLYIFFIFNFCYLQIAYAMDSILAPEAQEKLNNALFYAAGFDPGRITKLVNEGAQMDAQVHNRTALHHAAECNSIAGIQSLINAGASLSVKDIHGNLPLFTAIEHGNYDAVRMLLRKDPNQQPLNSKGQTALDFCNNLTICKDAKKKFAISIAESNRRRKLTLRALVTTVSQCELKHVPFIILCFIKAEPRVAELETSKQLCKDVCRLIAKRIIPMIMSEKLALAKKCLPDIPVSQLRKLILESCKKTFAESMSLVPKLDTL